MEVKIGIIGAKFAGDFHAQSWAWVPGANIYAIADIDTEAMNNFASVHNVTRTYDDYKKLLEDPEIDLVDICLPNFLHAEVTIAAMEAGKDVICEKPMTMTIEESESPRLYNWIPRLRSSSALRESDLYSLFSIIS